MAFGTICESEPLVLTSHMAENGVIFSDGMEMDYLPFNAGSTQPSALHRARHASWWRKEVSDAVGTTVEFKPPGTFPPVTDMMGGGPFGLQPGEWTDDTSMALCLATSLLETGGFDAKDQMDRYCRWRDAGYLSSNGRCFDIGNTVRQALSRYSRTGDPIAGSNDPLTAGNGSIMRLAPVAMFYAPDKGLVTHHCAESSRTTHGAEECVDACRLLGYVLLRALNGGSKEEVLPPFDECPISSDAIAAIANGEYKDKEDAQIIGDGYVVHSLEAALWCFWHTDSFETGLT